MTDHTPPAPSRADIHDLADAQLHLAARAAAAGPGSSERHAYGLLRGFLESDPVLATAAAERLVVTLVSTCALTGALTGEEDPRRVFEAAGMARAAHAGQGAFNHRIEDELIALADLAADDSPPSHLRKRLNAHMHDEAWRTYAIGWLLDTVYIAAVAAAGPEAEELTDEPTVLQVFEVVAPEGADTCEQLLEMMAEDGQIEAGNLIVWPPAGHRTLEDALTPHVSRHHDHTHGHGQDHHADHDHAYEVTTVAAVRRAIGVMTALRHRDAAGWNAVMAEISPCEAAQVAGAIAALLVAAAGHHQAPAVTYVEALPGTPIGASPHLPTVERLVRSQVQAAQVGRLDPGLHDQLHAADSELPALVLAGCAEAAWAAFEVAGAAHGETAEDYLQAVARRASTVEQRVTAKVGRNQPCPCGSGRKFKRCHGG